MSDVAKCKELLKRYSIARIPFIAINTIERARTLDILMLDKDGNQIMKNFRCRFMYTRYQKECMTSAQKRL